MSTKEYISDAINIGGLVGLPHTDIAHTITDIYVDSNGDAWVVMRNSYTKESDTWTAKFVATECVILEAP